MDGPYDAVWHGSKEDLLEYLRGLPAEMIHGNNDIRQGVADDLLGIFHEAFLVKARGDTDEAGIQWKSLAPDTVRKKKRNLQMMGVHNKPNEEVLTTRKFVSDRLKALERKIKRFKRYKSSRWKAWGAKKLREGHIGEGSEESYGPLSQELRFLKSLGAKMNVASGQRTDILIETHDLERSLDPKNLGIPHHVFDSRVSQEGEIIVGTTEKPWHHTCGPDGFTARNPPAKSTASVVKPGEMGGFAEEELTEKSATRAVKMKKLLAKKKKELRRAPPEEKARIAAQIKAHLAKMNAPAKKTKSGGTHKVPRRQFWPDDGNLPIPWWQRIMDGVKQRFGQVLSGQVMAQEQRSR